MNAIASDPTVQFIAWGIGLIELILGLYILLLNYKNNANRHSSALFILFAITNFAIGLLMGATSVEEARLPTALLAATIPSYGPALLVVAIVLLKPAWLTGRWKWFWRAIYFLAFLPALLVVVDLVFQTNLWFTGLNRELYQGGFTELSNYTSQTLQLVRALILIVIPFLSLFPLGYLAFRDQRLAQRIRRLAWLLFIAQAITVVGHLWLPEIIQEPIATLLNSAIYFLVYAYASFFNIISERREQLGRLQVRLTALVIVIAVPLLIGTLAFVSSRATTLIEQNAITNLETANNSVTVNANTWLMLNSQALSQLVNLPAITGMDPVQQKPVLEAMANAFPHMYLVSTTDTMGLNLARNDSGSLTDYSDRLWYQSAISGTPLTFQTVIGRTSGAPALVVSKPIQNASGAQIGVGMFATDLDEINLQVGLTRIGETGIVYIVDQNNLVIAHPDAAYTAELRDLADYPPVQALRSQQANPVYFTDEAGVRWIAHVQEIDFGWGIIVQQQAADALGALATFQAVTWIVLGLGTALLGGLTALAIWQAIRPIGALTETAQAIAEGDFSRLAPVQSQDEIGLLAITFNRMTEQLLELIGGLELRVSERTRDLEQRSRQLEATAEVSQVASTILDTDQLLEEVVDLIRERFELYYVGLFLVDEPAEWAVLHAGTGQAGQAMLARQHMIRIGEGMIGWSVANSRPRVATEAGEDALRLATTELPETRSEAAIPLRSRNRVLGAISVQSAKPGAFDESTIAILQTMADLVGVAIDNSRLYSQSEVALQSTRRAYGELSRQAWLDLMSSSRNLTFISNRRGTSAGDNIWLPEMQEAWLAGRTVQQAEQSSSDSYPLAVPIRVRGIVIGVIQSQKPHALGPWTAEEIRLIETVIEQLGVTLDSARLYEETQKQAQSERLIGEVTARMRQTLDIEAVLKSATRELRSALDLAEVEIRLGSPNHDNG